MKSQILLHKHNKKEIIELEIEALKELKESISEARDNADLNPITGNGWEDE